MIIIRYYFSDSANAIKFANYTYIKYRNILIVTEMFKFLAYIFSPTRQGLTKQDLVICAREYFITIKKYMWIFDEMWVLTPRHSLMSKKKYFITPSFAPSKIYFQPTM